LGHTIVTFDEAAFRLVPVYHKVWFLKGQKPNGVFFWSNKKLEIIFTKQTYGDSIMSSDQTTTKKPGKHQFKAEVKQLLDIMDSTVEKSEFMHGGQAENTFKSMLNEELSKNFASNPASSFGFAKQIYEQMKNQI